MSFHVTAQEVRVDDKHVLVAQLQNEGGEYIDATLDLNQFLGNNNGMPSPSTFFKLLYQDIHLTQCLRI